ncbi:hypothetical protein JW710_01395 [Candidatus Dojkabacteria bacterium]|nr:hypothetical protein [Candidatus Dojkabacteria bacterium]
MSQNDTLGQEIYCEECRTAFERLEEVGVDPNSFDRHNPESLIFFSEVLGRVRAEPAGEDLFQCISQLDAEDCIIECKYGAAISIDRRNSTDQLEGSPAKATEEICTDFAEVINFVYWWNCVYKQGCQDFNQQLHITGYGGDSVTIAGCQEGVFSLGFLLSQTHSLRKIIALNPNSFDAVLADEKWISSFCAVPVRSNGHQSMIFSTDFYAPDLYEAMNRHKNNGPEEILGTGIILDGDVREFEEQHEDTGIIDQYLSAKYRPCKLVSKPTTDVITATAIIKEEETNICLSQGDTFSISVENKASVLDWISGAISQVSKLFESSQNGGSRIPYVTIWETTRKVSAALAPFADRFDFTIKSEGAKVIAIASPYPDIGFNPIKNFGTSLLASMPFAKVSVLSVVEPGNIRATVGPELTFIEGPEQMSSSRTGILGHSIGSFSTKKALIALSSSARTLSTLWELDPGTMLDPIANIFHRAKVQAAMSPSDMVPQKDIGEPVATINPRRIYQRFQLLGLAQRYSSTSISPLSLLQVAALARRSLVIDEQLALVLGYGTENQSLIFEHARELQMRGLVYADISASAHELVVPGEVRALLTSQHSPVGNVPLANWLEVLRWQGIGASESAYEKLKNSQPNLIEILYLARRESLRTLLPDSPMITFEDPEYVLALIRSLSRNGIRHRFKPETLLALSEFPETEGDILWKIFLYACRANLESALTHSKMIDTLTFMLYAIDQMEVLDPEAIETLLGWAAEKSGHFEPHKPTEERTQLELACLQIIRKVLSIIDEYEGENKKELETLYLALSMQVYLLPRDPHELLDLIHKDIGECLAELRGCRAHQWRIVRMVNYLSTLSSKFETPIEIDGHICRSPAEAALFLLEGLQPYLSADIVARYRANAVPAVASVEDYESTPDTKDWNAIDYSARGVILALDTEDPEIILTAINNFLFACVNRTGNHTAAPILSQVLDRREVLILTRSLLSDSSQNPYLQCTPETIFQAIHTLSILVSKYGDKELFIACYERVRGMAQREPLSYQKRLWGQALEEYKFFGVELPNE